MSSSEERSITFQPGEGWANAESCLRDWKDLTRETGLWLPFQEPVWSEVWWRHWSRNGLLRSDRFLLWVGRDLEGAVRAVLPTVLSERPGRGSACFRLLRPLGPDPNLTELLPILCRPEDTEAAHAGLMRALTARRREWDAFRWSSVPSGIAGGLRATVGAEHLRHVPDYVLALEGDWDAFRSRLPRNVKEAIRKAFNSAKRAGVDLSFSVTESAEEVRQVLPEFFRLHTARAAVEGVPRHPDAFVRPEARVFLADLGARWAGSGLFRVFSLRHRDRLVACRIAYHARESLYLYYSGYDPNYARHSVMTRTLVEGLQWAFRQGVRRVNLSTGADLAKTRWRPTCLEYEKLWLWSPSPRGRFLRRLAHLVDPGRRRLGAE